MYMYTRTHKYETGPIFQHSFHIEWAIHIGRVYQSFFILIRMYVISNMCFTRPLLALRP